MDPTLLIGDIVERGSDHKKPVEFPTAPVSSTGFPQHKKRWKSSAFKQQREARIGASHSSKPSAYPNGTEKPSGGALSQPNFEEIDKRRINEENQQKLDSMSPEEIARAQEDLMSGLNPALIQRLLQRANIDEPSGPSPFDITDPTPTEEGVSSTMAPEISVEQESTSTATEAEPRPKPVSAQATPSTRIAENYDESQAPTQIPPDLFPIVDQPKSTHFPVPPSLPDLNPSDPNFLATLHEKYFPNLPADPSKLAWMAPVPSTGSAADKESSYYPHDEISVSALRFDFRGRFLSPRVSRSIPSTKGLHHHGEAPEAAGYTVAELARLARSAVPAQRCMAFQTLGRILYRLGRGEWGKTEHDPIAMGVWNEVKKGKVLQSLAEAAMGDGGHRGSRAYATEALWLYEKGGWREAFKGR